ncbi:fibronectin type III domain-containing protein, partial [Arenibacter sp. F20364]|uniref:fibronectin type III domain-containing protein n=1 Tax=Arenibacter sp. F20364 TaxID=2926415 RepID=UPI001FF6BA39
MKKVLLLLLSFSLMFLDGAIGQDLHTQSNAASIANEANSTAGWSGTAVISSDNSNPQLGNFAIRMVSNTGNRYRMDYFYNATVGTDYVIRIWARQGPQVTVPAAPAFANWSGVTGFSTTVISETDWTEYVFNVTATSSNPRITIYNGTSSSGNTAGNTVFIDNVSILPAGGDTAPPTAPTNLVASGTTSTSTTLNWNASADNVGVTGYTIFQNGVNIGTTNGATTFNVTGLFQNTTYAFTVTARDQAGNISPVSNTANVTTLPPVDGQAPTAPSNLNANGTTTTTTNLSWTAATDNVGVTGYTIFQDGVSIGTTTGALTFNVTGLAQNTTYAFTVTATDAAGNVSPVSNTANVTTLTAADGQAPTAPSNLAANGTTTTTTNLSWTASTDNIGVTGYTIFQDGVSIGTTTGALTFNVTGLTQNT